MAGRREPISHDALAAVAARGRRAASRLLSAISPVFIPDERGDAELIGSGVLLRVGPSHFLVTAAHVMERGAGHRIHVGGESRIVEVSGHYSRTRAGPTGEADRFDLALIPLRDQEISGLRDARFLNVADLEPGERPDRRPVVGSKYMLLGFPVTKQRRTREGKVEVGAVRYLAKARPEDEYVKRGWSPTTYLMVEYDKKGSWNMRGRVTPPDPYGMSGGGLFKLYGWFDHEPQRETLVAIACEYTGRAGKSVVGSRVDAVLHGIATQYPHLQPWLPQT